MTKSTTHVQERLKNTICALIYIQNIFGVTVKKKITRKASHLLLIVLYRKYICMCVSDFSKRALFHISNQICSNIFNADQSFEVTLFPIKGQEVGAALPQSLFTAKTQVAVKKAAERPRVGRHPARATAKIANMWLTQIGHGEAFLTDSAPRRVSGGGRDKRTSSPGGV